MKGLLSIAVIFTFTVSFAQTDSSSIYYQALSYYNIHLDKLQSSDTIIFIDNGNNVFDTEFNSVGNRDVIFLTSTNIKEIYEAFGKRIKHLSIQPAQVLGDTLEIRFVPYFKINPSKRLWGKIKKGTFISLSDWIVVEFKMDHLKKEFKFCRIRKPIAIFPGTVSNK